MDLSKTHIELVKKVYESLESNIAAFKERKGNSLTLAEKILYGHSKNVNEISLNRGEDFGDLSSFLLSEKNSWITGQIFHIDGGRSTLRLKA